MIKAIPKEIAKYFKDSVSFDFSKEVVSSYARIEGAGEAFYALTDREAFSALLNDCISHDNQLVDIFLDLYDAELGIQKFAEKSARLSPRQFVSFFLNLQKYAYHINDISKVFTAVNTWLLFFGDAEIKPEWTVCPFCGANVVNGKCASCGKKTLDCMNAIAYLSEMLAAESRGEDTATPDYWNDIKQGGEFFVGYKSPITALRDARDREKRAKDEKSAKEKIAAAEKICQAFVAKADIEAAKDNPDFDEVLEEFMKEPAVVEALKYKDKKFIADVDAFRSLIDSKKRAAELKKTEKDRIAELGKSLAVFVSLAGRLEREIDNYTFSVADLKKQLKDADAEYSRILVLLNTGLTIADGEPKRIFDKWKDSTREAVSKFIAEREHRETLTAQQNKLIAVINDLSLEISTATPKDNKAGYFREKYNKEVEKNSGYAEVRTQLTAQYKEIVKPFVDELSKLTAKENELRFKDFDKESRALIKEIDRAHPKDGKRKSLADRFDALAKRFKEMEEHAEYRRTKSEVTQKLAELGAEERGYATARKKRNKIVKITAIVVSCLIVVLAGVNFMLEWSGVYSLFMAATAKGISGNADGGEICLTEADGDIKDLVIPEKTRLGWTFGEKTVTTIDAKFCSGNSVVETVELPSTIESIGAGAFSECSKLKSIKLTAKTPPAIAKSVLKDSDAVFYVPKNNYKAYMTDPKWADYTEIIFPDNGLDREHGVVIFDSTGGSSVSALDSFALGTPLAAASAPTMTGNTFVGWYAMKNGVKVPYTPGETVVKNSIKLYAEWTLDNYKITFDYNGGMGDTPEKYYTYSATFAALPLAVRPGYSFAGWYYKNKKIESDTPVDVLQDVTFEAKWTPKAYTVKFDYNGGGEDTVKTKTVTFDAAYGTLPSPTRLGYKFSGWFDGLDEIYGDTVVSTPKDHELKAEWTPISYTVVVASEGAENKSFTATYDAPVDIRGVTRNGYRLTGYRSGATVYSEGSAIKNLTATQGDVITLTAEWEIVTYSVTYYDGTHDLYETGGGDPQENPLYPRTYTIESDDIVPPPLTGREGYEFKYWCADAACTQRADKLPSGSYGNKTFYAKWQANTNTLHFVADIDGVTGEMEDITMLTDEKKALPHCTFSKYGYAFVGWKSSSAADVGAEIPDGDAFTMGAAPETTLYGVWERNNYRIDYELYGGENKNNNPAYYTVESNAIVLMAPTKPGYTFEGWFENAEYTGERVTGIAKGSIGNRTLYAKWMANGLEIEFDANGGTGFMQALYVRTGEICTLSQNSFKNGTKRFVGWSKAKNGSVDYSDQESFVIGIDPFFKLYAVWADNKFIISYVLNGGKNSSLNPTMFNYNDNRITLQSPTKLGNDFDGWYTDTAFKNRVTSIVPSTATADLTLHAHWIPKIYRVILNYNNSVNGGQADVKYYDSIYTDRRATYGSFFYSGSLPTPTKTGHTFDGWYYENTNTKVTASTYIVEAKNHTLNAKYTVNSYYLYIKENHTNVRVVYAGTNTTISSGTRIAYGTKISISVSAASGYKDPWCTYNGQTIAMPANNVTIDSGATEIPQCIAKGSMITLADGTTVPVETLKGDEELLVWNMFTGEFDSAPILFIDTDIALNYNIVHLFFSDGTDIEIIYEHAFYDTDLNKYVFLRSDAAEYIGHSFKKHSLSSTGELVLSDAILLDVKLEARRTEAYSPVTFGHLCYFVNGMLSMPGATEGLIDIFEVDRKTMTVDREAYERDVRKYGLFTYEEFYNLLPVPELVFEAFGGKYLKVSIGKGLITVKELTELFIRYAPYLG